jgi:hypothetical protein
MSRKDQHCNGPTGAGLLALTLLVLALFAGVPALAQVGQNQSQTHQLRANIAMARSIAPEVAKRYGIDQGTRIALVDVVVTRLSGGNETVPASVEVRVSNLTGQTSRVHMRAISEAGRTSYLGTYTFAPDEVTDFDVVARPENSNEELRVRVREHFPPN